MSADLSGPVTTQSVLVHVCTRPERALPDALLEPLATDDQADRLVEVAERTMVAGLLWSALSPDQRALLPASARERLQSLHLGNALRWQAYRKLLVECLRELAAADIPAAPLKGMALLLEEVYPDPGQRTLADIDLLVPEEHLATAHALLGRDAAEVLDLRSKRHLGTIQMQGEVGAVEVHGAATHGALWPQTGDLIATGRSTAVDDAHVFLPTDANTWLHVACHGLSHAPHYWPRMAADLARLHGMPRWGEANWREVWQTASSRRREQIVLLAAAMAGCGLVPEGLRQAGAPDAQCDFAAARARKAWGIATTSPIRNFGPWRRLWVAAEPRYGRQLLAHIFLPMAVAKRRLKAPQPLAAILYPGYALLRALKLIWTGLVWRVALRRGHFPERMSEL